MFAYRKVASLTFADGTTKTRVGDDEIPAHYLMAATATGAQDWEMGFQGSFTKIKALSGLQIVVLYYGLRDADGNITTLSPQVADPDEQDAVMIQSVIIHPGEEMSVYATPPVMKFNTNAVREVKSIPMCTTFTSP